MAELVKYRDGKLTHEGMKHIIEVEKGSVSIDGDVYSRVEDLPLPENLAQSPEDLDTLEADLEAQAKALWDRKLEIDKKRQSLAPKTEEPQQAEEITPSTEGTGTPSTDVDSDGDPVDMAALREKAKSMGSTLPGNSSRAVLKEYIKSQAVQGQKPIELS